MVLQLLLTRPGMDLLLQHPDLEARVARTSVAVPL